MIAIDMEMPKNCDVCRFEDAIDCMALEGKNEYSTRSDSRLPDCPLKEAKLHRKCKRVDLYEVAR